jgi:hypothetical protein
MKPPQNVPPQTGFVPAVMRRFLPGKISVLKIVEKDKPKL